MRQRTETANHGGSRYRSGAIAPRRFVALTALLALAACAHSEMGKSTGPGSSAAVVQLVYPNGLLTTAEALPQTRGIYAVPVGGGEACCWTDRDVVFLLPAPPGAKSLHIAVTVPALPGLAGKQQNVTELDSDGKAVATRAVSSGTAQSLSFPLPSGRAGGLVLPVHLHMSASVVPHDVSAGPDTRRLALIMTDAYAR